MKCPAHEHGTSCQQADQVAKRPFKSNPFGVEEIQQQQKIKKSLGAFWGAPSMIYCLVKPIFNKYLLNASLPQYILITGAGAAFYFCQICSKLKTAGDTKPQASPELILASSSFQIWQKQKIFLLWPNTFIYLNLIWREQRCQKIFDSTHLHLSKSDQLLISINFDNNVMTKALIWQHAKQTHQQFNHYYNYSKSLADQSRFPILPASLLPPSSYQEPKVPQDVLLQRRVQTLLPKKFLSKFSPTCKIIPRLIIRNTSKWNFTKSPLVMIKIPCFARAKSSEPIIPCGIIFGPTIFANI